MEQQNLKRELKSRHLTMIAIGGSIGTGLFIASGATIANAGPLGALLSYIIIGIMVYFLMTSLGELASYLPTSGTFSDYGARYVDKSLGFALGWNYWYNWAITVAADLVAAQLIMSYWIGDSHYNFLFSLIFLGIIFLLNCISVKGFGEAEFWFALIKVITIIVFIGLGLLMIIGILSSGGMEVGGFKNWDLDGGPFVNGFAGMVGVAMIVGFSFQGTELIGVAAGEAENPGKNIPKAIKAIFWRILLFYILSIFVISLIIPYNDPRLLLNQGDDININVSPFTIIFENIGILGAASIMNAVILTSVLSSGNSGLYASTRMLFSLAKLGDAPKIFLKLSKNGIPIFALLATTFVACLCFLTYFFENGKVYSWLLNLSGMVGFLTWLGISISHYRFRKGMIYQKKDLSTLPYKARLFPFAPIISFIICLIIIIGQDYKNILLSDKIDRISLLSTYLGLILFFILFFVHKLIFKTKYIKYSEMDLQRYK